MGEMDDLVKDFLVEANDNLDRMDREFVQLEGDPGNRELLASIFRAVHTVKGTSGFFGFTKLQSVAHAGETLMAKLRDGAQSLNEEKNTKLLAMVDAIRAILNAIAAGGNEGVADYEFLCQELLLLAEGGGAGAAGAPVASAPPAAPAQPAAPAAAAPAAIAADLLDSAPKKSVEDPAKGAPAAAGASAPVVVDQSIRVDVQLLDQLMNLVGELVLARNQILSRGGSDPAMVETTKRLDQITTKLQEGVMKTRLQPIGSQWQKLPRIVRDLSRDLGKQVKVVMEGEGTELDKSIIEAVKDPLTHMVRNAMDHGIEKPDARVAAGKPPEGTLQLRAFHEGGQVNIEIIDDGRGIDPAKVKAKAVEKGILTADQAAKMNDRDAINLVFAPGFSTAEQVTNVSGRGVGMDVVRTNIEKIGGVVDIASQVGRGSTIRIRIPLTLAIIPALIVRSGGERFAIPQVSLVELVRLSPDKAATEVEDLYGTPVYRLRGKLLPLVGLNRQLALAEGPSGGAVNIVVLSADERQFGLVVDQVVDTGEIVVKSLDEQLKRLEVFAGATIMGDGSVALILDVLGLGVRSGAISRAKDAAAATTAAVAERRRFQRMVVFRSPDEGRMAIPLDGVVRLEKIPTDRIESTGGAEVVQYRGEIMPLIRVFARLPERRKVIRNPSAGVPDGVVHVVVHRHGERAVGLIVGEILDTVEVDEAERRPPSRAGISHCVVIATKVTEILDAPGMIAQALADHVQPAPQPSAPATAPTTGLEDF